VSDTARLLIDAEMKMFHGLATPVIFVQNVVTDLLLGIGFDEAFRIFADHVRERYNAEPGFITMNLPRLLDALDRVGIENPIVCANINKIGFRMSGGRALYEQTIRTRRFRCVCMSVLASGGRLWGIQRRQYPQDKGSDRHVFPGANAACDCGESVATAVEEFVAEGSENDHEIEPDGEVLNIGNVVVDAGAR
jgi:hypothetical protein